MGDVATLLGAIVGLLLVGWSGAWFLERGAAAVAAFGQPLPPDPWPRGVQEDDDLHWDWRPPALEDDRPETLATVRVDGVAVRRR